jgi:hypothetical protein
MTNLVLCAKKIEAAKNCCQFLFNLFFKQSLALTRIFGGRTIDRITFFSNSFFSFKFHFYQKSQFIFFFENSKDPLISKELYSITRPRPEFSGVSTLDSISGLHRCTVNGRPGRWSLRDVENFEWGYLSLKEN